MNDSHPSSDDTTQIVNVLAVDSTPAQVFMLWTLYDQADAVNAAGQVYATRRDDDADNDMILSAADPLSCLWVSPQGRLWVGSSMANVYTTHPAPVPAPTEVRAFEAPDPAYRWQVTTLPATAATKMTPQIHALWGSSDDDVFAATWEGTIFHWNGAAWREMPTNSASDLVMLHGTGAADVWAAGADATLLHYDGLRWARVPTPPALHPTDVVTAVWAAGAGIAYACTAQGKILRGDRAGMQIVAQDDGAKWYGITVFQGVLILSDSRHGVFSLTPAGLASMKGNFLPVAQFHAGDRLYFIQTDQPEPAVVEYDPSRTRPWGRIEF